MTDAELIAEFLAKKGATRVATGIRTMDERQMYNAVRGRDTTARQPRFHYVHNTYYGDVLVNEEGEPV